MTNYRLELNEDRVVASTEYLTVPPKLNCVLYVVSGEIIIEKDMTRSVIGKENAVFVLGPCKVQARSDESRILRFELIKESDGFGTSLVSSVSSESRLLIRRQTSLDVSNDYLIRCDRVDFDLGSEALPHRHRGGGIRWLAAGELKVKQGDADFEIMHVGDAWFEDGKLPVHALASTKTPTAFIRVSILPREIRGKSSIMYVNPSDANRSKARSYKIYIDQPIEI